MGIAGKANLLDDTNLRALLVSDSGGSKKNKMKQR
jgi:hypothetical protein